MWTRRILNFTTRRRGVAIVTVLSLVALMAILVIGIMNLGQSQQEVSRGVAESQRVNQVKDVAINLVTAQIIEAMRLEGTTLTTQPGGARTFSNTSADKNRFYKFYTSPELVIRGINPGDTGFTRRIEEQDIVKDWAARPDELVNLNAAIQTDDPTDPGNQAKRKLHFPIADPRIDAEGFDLKSDAVDGINRSEEAPMLPMPVRWMYILRDGTTGYLRDGVFVPSDKRGSEASRENPMVSRIAWWTDDESARVNVNTASTPAYWATPVTNSAEDHAFARSQPMMGEFQRFPGHPATVDMAAVLFPGRRWVAPRLRSLIPAGSGSKQWGYLNEIEVQLMWDIAPFVRMTTADFGSLGGERDTLNVRKIGRPDESDHLFTSFSEMYFKARSAVAGSGALEHALSLPRESLEGDDPGARILRKLERSGFLLTTRSSAPAMNPWGHPQISMYPEDVAAAPMIKAAASDPGAPVALPAKVGPYDLTAGVASTAGDKSYFFQRQDSTSRHAEIGAYGDTVRKRNLLIYNYLKKMTSRPVPGYAEYAGTTFATKYPAPSGGPESYSDHSQIIASMLDYVRMTNMNNDLLTSANQYNSGGFGQTTGICLCPGGDSYHQNILGSGALSGQVARGAGRACGLAEVMLVLSCIAEKKNGVVMPGAAGDLTRDLTNTEDWNTLPNARIYQLWLVGNAFSPAMGWKALHPSLGLGARPASAAGWLNADAARARRNDFPITMGGGLSGPQSMSLVRDAAINYNRSLLWTAGGGTSSGLIPWGGMYGPKPFVDGTNCAWLGKIAVQMAGGRPVMTMTMDKTKPLVVYLYDNTNTGGAGNVVQALRLTMPPMSGPVNGLAPAGDPAARLSKAKTDRQPAFSDAADIIFSFAVPHGDYRLAVTPLNADTATYRPHARFGKPGGGSSFWEPLEGRFVRADENVTRASTAFIVERDGSSANWQPGMSPHLPDSDASDTWSGTYQNAPAGILAAASSISPERAVRFGYSRRDVIPRGSSDPAETGDFDQGPGNAPDGAYLNNPDDGDMRATGIPYFTNLTGPSLPSPATFSPNRMVSSPVMFGSIPSGVNVRVPWQTLRFRPDPGMNDPSLTSVPAGQPFSNYRSGGRLLPRDHHLLEYFRMPVIEPYAISDAVSDKGKINMNQQIFPFTYIERTTALHALFRGERMLAIDPRDAVHYKTDNDKRDGTTGYRGTFRRFVSPSMMVHQFTQRYRGYTSEAGTEIPVPFNVFRSAGEICELWMAPEPRNEPPYNEPDDRDPDAYLKWIAGAVSGPERTRDNSFWERHKLTGDNSRERPYANIYPKLCVRSNAFRIHIIAQTLQKADGTPEDEFSSTRSDNPDLVTAQWRGHAVVERTIDPRDAGLQGIDYLTDPNPPSLDAFATMRVTEVQQLTD